MAFRNYCSFSIIVMLHAACHLWRGPRRDYFSSSEVGPESSTLSPFFLRNYFFEQPRIQEDTAVRGSPCRGRWLSGLCIGPGVGCWRRGLSRLQFVLESHLAPFVFAHLSVLTNGGSGWLKSWFAFCLFRWRLFLILRGMPACPGQRMCVGLCESCMSNERRHRSIQTRSSSSFTKKHRGC